MSRVFSLTRRHYDIILKQGLDNYPEEVGGFLGGVDDQIKAIQPLFNQHLFNKTDTFSFTQEDVLRAHEFFKKHKLNYYGLYHTHPKGVAYPSKEDIATGHKYHFILSLRDQSNPVFAAYQIIRNEPHYIPIQIVENDGFSAINIHSGEKLDGSGKPISPTQPVPGNVNRDVEDLSQRIHNIRESQENTYERLPPREGLEDNSDFSALA